MKKYPVFLVHSEKKIMNTIDFLLNKMGYQSCYTVSIWEGKISLLELVFTSEESEELHGVKPL